MGKISLKTENILLVLFFSLLALMPIVYFNSAPQGTQIQGEKLESESAPLSIPKKELSKKNIPLVDPLPPLEPLPSPPTQYIGQFDNKGESFNSPPPLPQSSTIRYYTKNSANIKYIAVEINNKPFEAMFDSGASFVAVDNKTVVALGLQPKDFLKKGVVETPGGKTISFSFYCDKITLGLYTVTNVECVYIPSLEGILLGGSFLSFFNYSVNANDMTITLFQR